MLVQLLQPVRKLEVLSLMDRLDLLLLSRAQSAVAREICQLHRGFILVEGYRFGVYSCASAVRAIKSALKHVLRLAWVDLSSAVPLGA